MEKAPEADREFAKLSRRFVILHFDTRNGRAPGVKQLKVKRNQTYGIVLNGQGMEIARINRPAILKPVVKLMREALAANKSLQNSPKNP